MKPLLTAFALFTLLWPCRGEQPNIVIYMVDDLGWNHISAGQVIMGTHREEYCTPHLEKLANEGLSFTHDLTWKPKYPTVKETGKPSGPPPILK